MAFAFAFLYIIVFSTASWLLSTVYTQLLSRKYSRKIAQSSSAADSCQYRRTYKRLLIFEKVIYAVFALVSTMCLFEVITHNVLHLDTPGRVGKYFSSSAFWYIYALMWMHYIVLQTTNTSYVPFDPVPSISKKQVKGDFILFLRGFGCDNTLPANHQEKRTGFFSEHTLLQRLAFVHHVYAIGRPEELKSPSGTTRILLDNETWQSDVKELMLKAKCVIILVNDKANCIWEIAQSEEMQGKVVYLVNNKDKYERVCQELPKFNLLEKIPEAEHFFMYYDRNRNVCWEPFSNTGPSYWNIIRKVRTIAEQGD